MHIYESAFEKVVIGGRRSGKTTALVEWAKSKSRHIGTQRVIIAASHAEAQRLHDEHGVEALAAAAMQRNALGRDMEVVVDDIGRVFAELTGIRISGFSVNTMYDPLPESDETTLLRDRDEFQKQRIRTLETLVDTLRAMLEIECDGCIYGSDLGVDVHPSMIANVHPECPVHGEHSEDPAYLLECLRAKQAREVTA